jgi:hypothetical protein
MGEPTEQSAFDPIDDIKKWGKAFFGIAITLTKYKVTLTTK